MQIGIYARVSSERQAQEGTIESQIAAVVDFVQQEGGKVEPDLIFTDNGVSGSTLIRPALDTLRDKAAAREITKVYVLSPDRLARKHAHQLLLIEEVKRLQVEIAFVNKSISDTPEDQMLLQIQGVISEYEREKILERSRRGKLHAAKKGRISVLSGAPYGSRQRPQEEWISIPVPQIIEPALFETAATRLKEKIRFSPRNNKKYAYLLSGLVRCSECGYAIYGKPASTSRYKRCYYRCMGQDGHRWPNGRACNGHPIRVEVLDELVWNETKKLIVSPEIVLNEYARRAEQSKSRKNTGTLLLQKKDRELAQSMTEKTRLLDLYQLGAVSMEEVEPRLKSVRVKIQKALAEISLIKKSQEQENLRLHVISRFEEFAYTLTCKLESLSFEEKKNIVRLLVTDVIVDSTKEEILVKHVLPLKKVFHCVRGVMSPLPSNIVLDEFDQELTRRGHRFVRYADDANLYVRSEKAGKRVMASITRFITKRLKLKVNETKSAVDKPWNRKFLGFTFVNGGYKRHPRRKVAPKAIERLKEKIRAITKRTGGRSVDQVIARLNRYLNGWIQYFKHSEVKKDFELLDSWIKRKLRCMIWKQWGTGKTRYRELKRRGVRPYTAWVTIKSGHGPWRLSRTPGVQQVLNASFFKTLELPSLTEAYLLSSRRTAV